LEVRELFTTQRPIMLMMTFQLVLGIAAPFASVPHGIYFPVSDIQPMRGFEIGGVTSLAAHKLNPIWTVSLFGARSWLYSPEMSLPM
jgi:hypothetical protein